jgi:NADPH:quinone reductase-like Zn-dependent oxidoreductase
MEDYRIDRFGSVDGIVLRSSEEPRPGLREVVMRVRARSLNYRDLMVLRGGGRGPTKLGVIPLSDGAGEVAAIGEGGTRVKIGDRIARDISSALVWRPHQAGIPPSGSAPTSTGSWHGTRSQSCPRAAVTT